MPAFMSTRPSNVEQELDRITHTLIDFSYTLQGILNELRALGYVLSMLFGIVILGIAIIVGTLRHWF
jgi:TctA family transporter